MLNDIWAIISINFICSFTVFVNCPPKKLFINSGVHTEPKRSFQVAAADKPISGIERGERGWDTPARMEIAPHLLAASASTTK